MTNRQIHIVELPKDKLGAEHFRLADGPMPQAKEGELLLKTRLISLDAANRAWMQGATYRAAIEAGQVMAGGAVAEVVEEKAQGFAKGDLVFADTGWQEYASLPAKHAQKLPRIEPISHLLSVYGIAGLTAYFGLLNVGKPKAGETVVVSAAAGSVGVFVGQIAKIKGCRVVGIAGSDDKCQWIVDELGFDAAINYKTEKIGDGLKRTCPKGIDIYFENVGGEILDAVLARINQGARISVCGMISQYNATEPVPGPYNLINILAKRAKMQGFIVTDYMPRAMEGIVALGQWYSEGKLKYRVDIVEGLKNAPAALNKLFEGSNQGKLIVQL